MTTLIEWEKVYVSYILIFSYVKEDIKVFGFLKGMPSKQRQVTRLQTSRQELSGKGAADGLFLLHSRVTDMNLSGQSIF